MTHSNQKFDEDEISIWELIETLAQYSRWIIGSVVGTAIVSTIICLAIPKKFEAKTQLRIGSLPGIQTSGTGRYQTTPIEDVDTFQSFLASAKLEQIVTRKVGAPANIDFRFAPKKSGLIELMVRSNSPGQARQGVEEVVIAIKNRQNAHFDAEVGTYQTVERAYALTIEQMESTLAKTKPTLENLEKIIPALTELREKNLALRTALMPSRTYMTEAVGEVEVSDNAVYPKTLLTVVISSLGALFLSMVVAFAHKAWKSRPKA